MAATNDSPTLLAMARAFDPFLEEVDAVDTGAEEMVRLTVKNADVPVSDPRVGKNLWSV